MNSDTVDIASQNPNSAPETGMLTVYRAPESVTTIHGRSIFLAGSIKGGPDAWQGQVIRRLAQQLREPATVFDARRDDWEGSWAQRAFDPSSAAQTAWERDQRARADVVVFYAGPASSAPLSLHELSLAVRRGKDVVVWCPDGFAHRRTVEAVCERMKVPLVGALEKLVQWVEEKLQ